MKVAFKTLGCRLNQAEEGDFAAQFAAAGCILAKPGEKPDILVLHSCAVTRAAERETFRLLRAWRRDPALAQTHIVVTGCAVACNSADLLSRAGADLVVPKRDLASLASLVLGRYGGTAARPLPRPGQLAAAPIFATKRALLKVQDGCGFDCAYCIVPRTRGKPVSRPWEDALRGAEVLLSRGFKELVLTGCNLACYHDGAHGLADLADAVCRRAETHGARVRLGSVEPGICDEELRDLLLAHRNLCRFLHYPIQSGDSAILHAMGRHYTAEYIAELLDGLCAKIPRIGLGADFITGLPGEDEAAFARTCALVRRVPFAHIHVFPFSPRQGTRAPGISGRPTRTEAKARAAHLRMLGDAAADTYRRLLIGHETEVLVERRSPDGLVCGWNEGHVLCEFTSDAPVATLASFTPTHMGNGVLLASPPHPAP